MADFRNRKEPAAKTGGKRLDHQMVDLLKSTKACL
jgi:hypothetical protein